VLLSAQGAKVIAALVKQAAGRISIMAGGGVTATNAAQLQELGVRELHSSAKT
jgi:copper homeostasis protein